MLTRSGYMKIIDTTTYFEEKLMMNLRFNILNSYVDHFIVCEAIMISDCVFPISSDSSAMTHSTNFFHSSAAVLKVAP